MANQRRRRPQKGFLERWVDNENARNAKKAKAAREREQEKKKAEAEAHTARVRRRNEELERMLVDRPQDLESKRAYLKAAFTDGGAEAMGQQLRYILDSGDRPRFFPRSSQVFYRPDSRQLQVAYELPAEDMTPPFKGSRYVKVRDEVDKIGLNPQDLRRAQQRVIARTILRAFADTFDATPPDLVDSVAVNGYLAGDDPSTGKPTDLIVASARVDRRTFGDLVLTSLGLDPIECLKRFDSEISKDPYAFRPIAPVVRFDSALSSSEAGSGAFLTTGDRLDLLAIKPRDFEKIVHKWAAAYYGHAVLTPASRDGGIDVLATAKNDLADVRYGIEVKQYRNVVPFEKVRSLHGAMTKRDVHHGILVTTAWFGKDSRDYAADSRLTLIDGRRLRYLLAKHSGINSVIPHTTLPPGWTTLDIT